MTKINCIISSHSLVKHWWRICTLFSVDKMSPNGSSMHLLWCIFITEYNKVYHYYMTKTTTCKEWSSHLFATCQWDKAVNKLPRVPSCNHKVLLSFRGLYNCEIIFCLWTYLTVSPSQEDSIKRCQSWRNGRVRALTLLYTQEKKKKLQPWNPSHNNRTRAQVNQLLNVLILYFFFVFLFTLFSLTLFP